MNMEIEQSTKMVAKNLKKIARIVLYLIKKGISKSQLVMDLHLMFKKSNKAVVNLLFHNSSSSSFTSSSSNFPSFISPPTTDYEFSCRSTPVSNRLFAKRKQYHVPKSCDANMVGAVQNVLEMLNEDAEPGLGPWVESPFLGLGKTRAVRQLRVTDSPFPMREEKESDNTVDVAAEEFIKRFYKDLIMQKDMTSTPFESPCNERWNKW